MRTFYLDNSERTSSIDSNTVLIKPIRKNIRDMYAIKGNDESVPDYDPIQAEIDNAIDCDRDDEPEYVADWEDYWGDGFPEDEEEEPNPYGFWRDSANIDNFVSAITSTMTEVVKEEAEKMVKLLGDGSIWYYLRKFHSQSKRSKKITNPSVTFDMELKEGKYDQIDDFDLDCLHVAAKDLSLYWQSKPEASLEDLESMIGREIVHEAFLKLRKQKEDGNGIISTFAESLTQGED